MKPLDSRILDIYEQLTRLEKQLAGVVLEHQRDLASYSATELARQANVSKSTAARLFRRLGYASYDEARREARALRAWGSPLSLFDGIGAQPAVAHQGAKAHAEAEIANITRTFDALRPEAVDAAVTLLARPGRVWVIGFRGSHPVAELAAFWLKYLRKDISFLPSGWMTFAEDVIDMAPGDTVLAIGLRRRPEGFRDLLRTARDAGADIVLITDLSASTSARHANVVLRCHNRSPTLFDSLAAAVSLLNHLLGALALRLGGDIRQRLESVEALAERMDSIGPARGTKQADRTRPVSGRDKSATGAAE